MGKKDKPVFALAENLQSVAALVSQLETFIKVHKEIAAGYQKYRKNGGEAIPGVEKYLGSKEPVSAPAVKIMKAKGKNEVPDQTEVTESEQPVSVKKSKKKQKE
jgi:hypothetical protein